MSTVAVWREVVACPAKGTKAEEGSLLVVRLAGTVASERADVSEFHFVSNESKAISHLNMQEELEETLPNEPPDEKSKGYPYAKGKTNH